MKKKIGRVFITLLAPLFSLFVILHFTIILLGVIPPNPITVKHNTLLKSYVSPIFTQNWHLFAPDPVSDNTTAYLQVKYLDDDDKIITSEWTDVSTGLVKANQKNPLSPINRIVRIHGGVQSSNAIQDDLAWEYINSEKGEKREKYEEVVEKIIDDFSEQLVQRYANSLASKYFQGKEIEETRVMWVIEEAIPFSERNNSNFEPELSSVILEWNPYFYVLPPLK